MKKWIAAIWMTLCMMAACLSYADGPVLLMELPEDAVQVESVEFDGGDFVQTYSAGGMQIQVLRYTDFAMTAEELIASDWPLCLSAQISRAQMQDGTPVVSAYIEQVVDAGGYAAAPEKAGQPGYGVQCACMAMYTAGDTTLILQMIGTPEDVPAMQALMQTVTISSGMPQEADVG